MIVGVLTLLSWICLLHYAIPEDEEIIHKIFFGVWLSLFFAFFPGIYASMAPVTEATFGHLNYSRDYGLLFTQSVIIIIISCSQRGISRRESLPKILLDPQQRS